MKTKKLFSLLLSLALVANYFWKLYLMRAEKKLIEAGKGGL